jgi:hypothetical protein
MCRTRHDRAATRLILQAFLDAGGPATSAPN